MRSSVGTRVPHRDVTKGHVRLFTIVILCGLRFRRYSQGETVETSTRLSLRMPTEWTTLPTTTRPTQMVAGGSQLATIHIRLSMGPQLASHQPEVMSSALRTARSALSRIRKKQNFKIRCTAGTLTRTLSRTICFCSSCFFGWVSTVYESLGPILTVP